MSGRDATPRTNGEKRIKIGPERRTRMEQAVARGESNSQILAGEGITDLQADPAATRRMYRILRDVKAGMADVPVYDDPPQPGRPGITANLHRPRDTYFGPASQATIDALIDALFPGHTQENKRRRQAARRAVA